MSQYSDVPGNSSTEPSEPNEDEDWKKYNAMQESYSLQQLTIHINLVLTILVAFGLTYFVFVSPLKMSAPGAANFLDWRAFAFFGLLAFIMFACNDSSSVRLKLIVIMGVFYGFSSGFLIALNFTVQAKYQNSFRGSPTYGEIFP
mgnify:CR=1 FL=1